MDSQALKPDEVVWAIAMRDANYRVFFMQEIMAQATEEETSICPSAQDPHIASFMPGNNRVSLRQ